jgi:DNA-binding response OmpR family regulator
MAALTPSYADVSLVADGAHVASNGTVVALAPAEMRLMASLLKAQGRSVRRTVLEMTAWGIWDTVAPGALEAAIRGMQAKLAALGSSVTISGTAGQAYALARA